MSLEEFINIVIDLITRYSFIVAILAILSLLLIFFNFFNAASSFFSSLFKLFKNICLLAYKFCKFIFNFIFKLGFIFSLISLIKRFINKIIERYRLKHSIYNVYPTHYKFNFFYRMFSPKLNRQLRYRYNLLQACFKTHDYIDKYFSYIVRIEASVGGGKTSFINGYSHIRTILFKEKIRDTCLSIETRFHDYPFSFIRNKIKKLYSEGLSENEILAALYKDPLIDNIFSKDKVYSDYIKEEPAPIILKTYVLAYSAEIRDNFILSNYKLFNRITNKYNYELDNDLFHIRDQEALNKFYLPSYSLIIEDEKALSTDVNTYDYREVASTGSSTILRLFRQLRGETTYYISSTQNTERIAKPIRELTNSFIRILSCDIVGNLPQWMNKQKRKEEKIYSKMLKKSINKGESWLHDNNRFKDKLFKIWDKKKKVISASFLKYKIRIASSLAELENTEQAREVLIVYPLSWCFGVYRTCEYSDLYDYILSLQQTKKTDHDLIEITSLYESNEEHYKELLKSKDQEVEEKKLKQAKQKEKIKEKINQAKQESREVI